MSASELQEKGLGGGGGGIASWTQVGALSIEPYWLSASLESGRFSVGSLIPNQGWEILGSGRFPQATKDLVKRMHTGIFPALDMI